MTLNRNNIPSKLLASALVLASLASTIGISVSAYTAPGSTTGMPTVNVRPNIDNSPQITNVSYTPGQGRLVIQVNRPNEVSVYNPIHEPQSRRYRMTLTNARIIGGPNIIPVQGDANVRAIRLTQQYSQNIPMVEVTIDLISDTPGLVFDTQKLLPDGSFAVSMHTTSVTQPQQPVVMNALSPTTFNTVPAYNYPMPQTQPYAPPASNYTPYVSPQPASVSMAPSATVSSVPGYYGNWPMVKDIFVSDHNLQVVSADNKPLQVERAFTLNTPNRYVLDVTPARLSPQLRNRLSMDDAPQASQLFDVRTSQLDDDTVRLVLNFKAYPLAVQLTQEQNSRVVRLSY